ncbi:MAG: hypothetical protein ACI86H_002134 [bacterium]|jgi:hypothetical protein
MSDAIAIRKNGVTFFAKNTVRNPSEAQLVYRIPAVQGDREKKLKTTYIDIEQVENRYGVILHKPFWSWGGDMGVNDQGVVIGCECVYTKAEQDILGLISLDLVRLGLERGKTAKDALGIITKFLEEHGQGGSSSYFDSSEKYNSSFLIVDKNETWILETVKNHWVARKSEDVATITNYYIIGRSFDEKSYNLDEYAMKEGLYTGMEELNFSNAFESFLLTYQGATNYRTTLKNDLMRIHQEFDNSIGSMFQFLRKHELPSIFDFQWKERKNIERSFLKHFKNLQVAGSMVIALSDDGSFNFFTGTAEPTWSIFKPVNFDPCIHFGALCEDEYQQHNSLWRRHEEIHRRLVLSSDYKKEILDSRKQVEESMLSYFSDFASVSEENFLDADQLVTEWQSEWIHHFSKLPFKYPIFNSHSLYWKKLNKIDGIEK